MTLNPPGAAATAFAYCSRKSTVTLRPFAKVVRCTRRSGVSHSKDVMRANIVSRATSLARAYEAATSFLRRSHVETFME